MGNLNCFVPMDRPPNHEDQLTRAFLLVLRLVPMAQSAFLELVRRKQLEKGLSQLPALTSLPGALSVETQCGGLLDQSSGTIVSVLLTNDDWGPPSRPLSFSSRRAIYDGVVWCSPEWLVIIENKLDTSGVWEDQLRPSVHSFEDTKDLAVQPEPIVIKWAEIIGMLSSLVGVRSSSRGGRELVSGSETLIIDDFMSAVDSLWPGLNPYTSLGVCRDDLHLLTRRCRSVMAGIGRLGTRRDPRATLELVDHTSQAPCRYAFLLPIGGGEGSWRLALDLYPGDTVRQAQRLYASLVDSWLSSLEAKGWQITNNLHFAFQSNNLCWATGARRQLPEAYMAYWKDHVELVRQVRRAETGFSALWSAMCKAEMMNLEDQQEAISLFDATARDHVNVCPGLRLRYTLSRNDAIALDSAGRLGAEVTQLIQQALLAWGQKLDVRPTAAAGQGEIPDSA